MPRGCFMALLLFTGWFYSLSVAEPRKTKMASSYSSVPSSKDKKSSSVPTGFDTHSSRQEQMKQFFQERQMDNESAKPTPASSINAQSSMNPPPNPSGQVKKVQNMMTELELM